MLKGWNRKVRTTTAIRRAWTTIQMSSRTPPSPLRVAEFSVVAWVTCFSLRRVENELRFASSRQLHGAPHPGNRAYRWRARLNDGGRAGPVPARLESVLS